MIGLIQIREELGLTQELMAMYLKINLSTLKMAETGLRALPTYALIKVAELEIKMAARNRQNRYKNIHPAEKDSLAGFMNEYDLLTSKENKCRYKSLLLERKLMFMVDSYKAVRERLQLIDDVLLENEGCEFDAGPWQGQQRTAINVLHKCGLPMQVLLKHTIAMLQAEIDLCKRTKLQIRRELPEFFSDENA